MRARQRIDPAVAEFRRHIGERVIFTPPGMAAKRGAVEHGVITGADHRMVYVDYGYPNPICPELGNSIATHPANLRMESLVSRCLDGPPRCTP
ncbi:hypothetical protein [Nocardia arthritidis]|uniref:Uncharacterized protein n=1 Tax=Nocardia arthritidis TaxID=228602 RepID=A0A6G9YTS5_9NOCA|nr:hypothetical protein [Nocardia arthritidis]QIS16604.1 hypothetical protein F5544_44005 [Nocardia arthritidis]